MSNTEAVEQAHYLIDHLDPSKLPAAVSLLEEMLDPVSRAIANAPYDDEPETEEERLAVAAAVAQYRSAPETATTHEDLLREFGFTSPEDLAREIARTS